MSSGYTVRYMRKSLDTIPIDQFFAKEEDAQAEFDRLAKAYEGDEHTGLSLLTLIDGDPNTIAIEDTGGYN